MSLSFPDDYPSTKMSVLEQHWEYGSSLLTKLKFAINEGFSWGMSRISKVEGCQKGGIKYNGDKTSSPTVKLALNFQNVNHLIGVLFLTNLINSLTFAYLGGLKHAFFLNKNLRQPIISV